MGASLVSLFHFNPATLKLLISNLQLTDIFDILFTAFLIYIVLWFLKRTRSLPAILGVFILLLIYSVSYWLNLSLTYKILQTLIGAFIVILVVIFQDEIKRFFYLIGSVGFKKQMAPLSPQTIDELVETLFMMAERHTGALIVIPGRESIKPYITGGFHADAEFSNPLILSLFDPHSPGHDGAVILENNKVEKFAVYLPLSKENTQLKNYGTRHRAALGLAERTDALVLVVSEEKGIVSLAHDGNLKTIKDKEELINILRQFLHNLFREKTSPSIVAFLRSFKANIIFIILALIISATIWAIISYPNLGIIQKNFIAPIEFTNIKSDMAVEEVKPLEVIATFSGRSQDFKLLDPGQLKVTIDLTEMNKIGKYAVSLNKNNLKYPSSLSLVSLEPAKIQFKISPQANSSLNVGTTTTK
ncbi:MAG: diadenylate cyclase [Parcubacteria group bacterium]|nr:diadenylate cyclase [Parcubacteria group bacterium]